MDSQELRRRFLEFFEKRGHTIVPSSSLVPDDPSVLLTTAGMQQFKPYYAELDPETTMHPLIGKPVGLNAASCQKSFRTSDIDEVGDERHLTFFEMLGNFSFGGYFKEKAIALAHEFITKELGLAISYVTVFEGKDSIGVPKDEESKRIWQSLGVSDIREEGMEDVFWGPTGSSGPCGPTTEIYCTNAAGQDIEIWNIVFNQYFYPGSRQELDEGVAGKKLEPLKKPGVDTGMGLERLAMISQKKSTIFETDLFEPLMSALPSAWTDERVRRIVVDHARAVAFLIADGVRPLNKGAGYILRRLIRRSIVHVDLKHGGSFSGTDTLSMGIDSDMKAVLEAVVEKYKGIYPELKKDTIFSAFDDERKKFGLAFRQGLKELRKLERVDAAAAFKMFESYGLPLELIQEFSGEKALSITKEDFEKEMARHREVSRAGKERKFGGHGLLLDTGELKAANEDELKVVTRLHTATHLLQAALRKVLGEGVHQAGSDITPERTRFDFTFDRKLTSEEMRQTELLVNEVIQKNLDMGYKEMPFQEAVALGALYSPREKYPDVVKVYSAWNSETGEVFSRELCGGPHVQHTREVGGFRIGKQESVSAGVRRIRGHLA
ncbi:MAG: alanine--tRNA ligase-related protein [bacterium]|nr:alanine--tRNA ligase-related protein [bacterium]